MKGYSVIALLLASVSAEMDASLTANNATASSTQSLAQSGVSMEDEDLEEQMKVFHQKDDEMSDDEVSDDNEDEDNLVEKKADLRRNRNKNKNKKSKKHTLPGKGNEAVDVNHAQATESSEDDNDDNLMQESSDEDDMLLGLDDHDADFDWENEDNFIELDNDVHIDSDTE